MTIDETIAYLNDLLKWDKKAISKLVDTRVPCNDELADHPTCQVATIADGIYNKCEVGLLGVLNGMFGVDENGRGHIAAEYDDDDNLVSFIRTK